MSHHEGGIQRTDPVKPHRSRWGRRIVIAAVSTFILLLLIVLLAPTVLSTSTGTRWVAGLVSQRIPGTLLIDDLNLGWFRGQHVAGVRLNDAQGQPVAVIDGIALPDASLLALARGQLDLGAIRIHNQFVHVVEYEDRTSNLTRALGIEPAATRESTARSQQAQEAQRAQLNMQLTVSGGRVTYVPHRGDEVIMRDLELTVNIPTIARMEGSVRATLTQGEHTGQIEAHGSIVDLFNARGELTRQRAVVDAEADLTNVPVVLLDSLLHLRGKAVALASDRLDLVRVSIHGPLTQPQTAVLEIRGDRVRSDLTLGTTADSLTASPQSSVHLTITPQAWPQLVADHATLARSRLLQPFDIHIVLQNLTFPYENGNIDLPLGAFAARMNVQDIVIQTEAGQTLALRDIAVAADSPAIGQAVNAVVEAVAQQDDDHGRVQLSISLRDLLLPDETFNAQGYSAAIDGRIDDLPVALVDELAGMRGLLVELLGPVLQTNVTAQLSPAVDAGGGVTGPVRIDASAQHFQMQLAATQQPHQLALDESAHMRIDLQPEVLAKLKELYPVVAETFGDLQIDQPARVQLELAEAVVPWTDFSIGRVRIAAEARMENLVLAGEPQLQGVVVESLMMRLPAASLQDEMNAIVEARWRSNDVASTLDARVTASDLLNGNPRYTADLRLADIPIRLADAVLDQQGRLIALLGDTLAHLNIRVTGDDTRSGVYAFDVSAESPRLLLDANGHYAAVGGIQLAGDSRAQFTLTPEAMRALQAVDFADTAPPIDLLEPMQLTLTVEQARIAWTLDKNHQRQLDPDNTSLSLQLVSAGTSFRAEAIEEPLELRNVDLAIVSRDLRDRLALRVEADLGVVDAPPDQPRGRIVSNTTLTRLIDAQGRLVPANAIVETQTALRGLPVAMIDALMRQEGLLVDVLGARIGEVQLRVRSVQPQIMAIDATITSPRVTTALTGQYVAATPRRLDLRSDGPGRYLMTPEAFAALHTRMAGPDKPRTDIRLMRDTVFTLDLPRFTLGLHDPHQVEVDEPPIDEPAFYDPQRTGLQLILRADTAEFEAPREEGVDRYTIEDFQLRFDSEALPQSLQLSLQSDVTVVQPDQTRQTGRLDSQTTITRLIDDSGGVDAMQARYQTRTRFTQLPIAPLDALLNMDRQLIGLFGGSASLVAEGAFSLTGEGDDLLVDLDSENTQTRILASIGQVVRLREDVRATAILTPELSDTLLKWGNPLLIDATGSNEPIRVFIPRENFNVPLALFLTDRETALRQLSLDAEIQLGTVELQDSWLLGAIMPELQKLGQLTRFATDQQAQFTTMQVSVRNGAARSNDVWLQTPDMVVGVQGTVNLVNERANLSVGIGSQTLRRFSFLRDIVPANEVYQISVRGPLNQLSDHVDLSPLFVPLASLTAQRLGGDRLDRVLRDLPIDPRGLARELTLPRGAAREWANFPREASPAPQEPETQSDIDAPSESHDTPDEQPSSQEMEERPRSRDTWRDLIDLIPQRER